MRLSQPILLLAAHPDQSIFHPFDPIARSATTNDKITILNFPESDIKSAHTANSFTASEHRRNQRTVPVGKCLSQHHRPGPKLLKEIFPSILEEKPSRGMHDRAVRIFVQVAALYLQLLRQPDIVIIQKRNESPTGCTNSSVACSSQSNVCGQINDGANVGIPVEVTARRFPGAVIDNNDF